MKTYPGNDYRKIKSDQSCSIPKSLPYWYAVIFTSSGDRYYARKSIWKPAHVTIFDRRQIQDIPQELASAQYAIQYRLTTKQNHELEDWLECLFLSTPRSQLIKNIA